MRERTEPTHVLRVEVPLDLRKRSPDFDVIQDAIQLVLTISRAALSGEICNEIQVNVEACSTPTIERTGGRWCERWRVLYPSDGPGDGMDLETRHWTKLGAILSRWVWRRDGN